MTVLGREKWSGPQPRHSIVLRMGLPKGELGYASVESKSEIPVKKKLSYCFPERGRAAHWRQDDNILWHELDQGFGLDAGRFSLPSSRSGSRAELESHLSQGTAFSRSRDERHEDQRPRRNCGAADGCASAT